MPASFVVTNGLCISSYSLRDARNTLNAGWITCGANACTPHFDTSPVASSDFTCRLWTNHQRLQHTTMRFDTSHGLSVTEELLSGMLRHGVNAVVSSTAPARLLCLFDTGTCDGSAHTRKLLETL